MRGFPKFDWSKYRVNIDVKNLPGLKKREEILRRERYLFNLAKEKMEQERKLLDSYREQIESLKIGYQKILDTIPEIQKAQAGGMIHVMAKQFLPLATYEVRNKEGFLIALASTQEQLQEALHNLDETKFPSLEQRKMNFERLLEKRAPKIYRGVERKVITTTIPEIGEINIFKVRHSKRQPQVTHYDTTDVLNRLNETLRSWKTQQAYKALSEAQQEASSSSESQTPPSTFQVSEVKQEEPKKGKEEISEGEI